MFISDFPEILWSRNRDLKTSCFVIISCLNLQLHVNLSKALFGRLRKNFDDSNNESAFAKVSN